jgi:class 3 adenylate cyclase/CheY-like chemotaxis protein
VSSPSEHARLRHELRTPLNHIIGYGEMLVEDAGAAASPSVAGLRSIVTDAKAVLALVNERLAPAGRDAEALDLSALGVDVKVPLERILSVAAELTPGAGAAAPDLARISEAARSLAALLRGSGEADVDKPRTVAARPSGSAGARGTILVVDDDEGNRDLLARRLAREGYAVRTAPDGAAALAALAAAPADLVLLDVMMPGIDGYEVLRRLKQDPATGDVPVLMISALDELGSVVRCIELGAEDYLAKPFEPVLLRARIGACLEKKRLHDRETALRRELAEWNRTLEARVEEQVGQLERLSRLKRFFSPQLAELIVAGGAEDPLRTHRREITVAFLDLRGFTAFAQTAEPEEVMGVLREYHAAMGEHILAHEGTLERFTGDGMMVFFNDPVPVADGPARAVRMALAMRDRVRGLAAGWQRRGHELGNAIGIAQGYATIGAIGFEGRWDYGAIGTVTNLAARLCAEARADQILVAQRVASAVEDFAEIEPTGPLTLKGFARPVEAFTVAGLH